MKIDIPHEPPPFVKEYIEFQKSMPRIEMGPLADNAVITKSVPLNAFIAAYLNTIWDSRETVVKFVGRNLEGNVSDQDKLQIVWNTLASFMEAVAASFGWDDPTRNPQARA